LVAAGPGGVSVQQFPVEQSIILLAVVLMGGVYNIWGAVIAGILLRALPQLLDQKLGVPPELLTILFGIGVMQVLLVQPKGIVEDLRTIGRHVSTRVRGGPKESELPATVEKGAA
jgi:branched-chain amino acid transport system permease protein